MYLNLFIGSYSGFRVYQNKEYENVLDFMIGGIEKNEKIINYTWTTIKNIKIRKKENKWKGKKVNKSSVLISAVMRTR